MTEENAKKTGIPTDPMILFKGVKAAGIPIYGCEVEAALYGIKEKVPPEIELLKQADFTKLIIESKKIIGGM